MEVHYGRKFWWQYFIFTTFLIQLLGLSFYSYLVILNPKKIIDDYQVGEGAIAPIRLIGSFIVPLVLIGIYLLFTSIEGAWIYFILGL